MTECTGSDQVEAEKWGVGGSREMGRKLKRELEDDARVFSLDTLKVRAANLLEDLPDCFSHPAPLGADSGGPPKLS